LSGHARLQRGVRFIGLNPYLTVVLPGSRAGLTRRDFCRDRIGSARDLNLSGVADF